MWNPFRKKESRAGEAISQFVQGQAIYTPREYGNLSKEGYQKNVIAFRCINIVAQAVSSANWFLKKGDQEIENHEVLNLLKKPNPQDGFTDFMTKYVAFLMISGNSYVEAARLTDSRPPVELYSLRPDRMRIIGGPKGMPEGYRYTANGVEVDYPADPITGASNIHHTKTFNPLDDWYGMAPIIAGAFAIDQHNAAGDHNAALLQNRAVPSGAMVFKTNPGDAEMKRVQQVLIERYSSPRNAGKPMVLGGEVDWKEMGISPKDMEYLQGSLQNARDICSAFGVPHVLVVPGESTYRNMEEARLMLWEETVIPILDRVRDGFLNGWLLPFFGAGLEFCYDLDRISALIPRRQMHRETVISEWTSGLITRDEARAALQYDESPIPGSGEVFFGDNLGQVDPASDTSGQKKTSRAGLRRRTVFSIPYSPSRPRRK